LTVMGASTLAGAFSAASGAVLTLSGGALTLTGTASFSGAVTAGAKTLVDDATTKLSALTIGGTGGLVNEGALTQTGLLTLGDAQGDAVLLRNTASGTWDLLGVAAIALGKSTASSIYNLGLFEKTGGSAVSDIAPTFANGGKTLVSSGTLDFQAAVTGTGADGISGLATLEFDSTVAKTQTIDFTGKGGVLDLGAPNGFSAALGGFDTVGSNDAVELLGKWSISGFSTNSGTSTLKLTNGSQTASLLFDGSYSQSHFQDVVGSGHTTITYT